MIKAIAIAAALTLSSLGAQAAEVGTRWSNGGFTRNTHNGYETSAATDNGSYRTEFNEFGIDVSANDFQVRGGINGGVSVDTDGLDGDSDIDFRHLNGSKGRGFRANGTLAVEGYTSEGYRAGNFTNESSSRNDFYGSEWGRFGESSTFSR